MKISKFTVAIFVCVSIILSVIGFGSIADASFLRLKTQAKMFALSLFPSTPLKTNQTLCYDVTTNTQTSCSNVTGQDGNYLKGQARSYTDNGDSTVTDNSTGLMWQKCSVGRSGSTCATGSATTMIWATTTAELSAVVTCQDATTAGYTDWRLPNVNELQSLVDYSRVNPSINITYFPNTAASNYWSASTFVNSPSIAWYASFSYGYVYNLSKTNLYYVRCVR